MRTLLVAALLVAGRCDAFSRGSLGALLRGGSVAMRPPPADDETVVEATSTTIGNARPQASLDGLGGDGSDERSPPLVVGIAGGSGSGKSELAGAIASALGGDRRVVLLQHDSYYRDLQHLSFAERSHVNFDHPESLETDLLARHVRALKHGGASANVVVPRYDFSRHARDTSGGDVISLGARDIIIVEGILLFNDPALAALCDMKLFVDAPADVRLARRLGRDVAMRGRTVDQVLAQWEATVSPMHARFVEPTRWHADVIVPHGVNRVALELVVARLTQQWTAAERGSTVAAYDQARARFAA